ncbi:DUF1003 domain-containing protein [Mesorhizobium sp. BAC0120]|uniref:DUF1003 domain-containing protein n=1 Tax=Mesorhizobium sp. BAC0120 TaxID=3090670 RepID=UPI00298C5664|nr:DUF1003 domain-containing protein [Mesorhizobium sp. BAC0120]MDW6026529.1 DUF1003 domain-containing protein [Mesorhizobium sp. BAC0120]
MDDQVRQLAEQLLKTGFDQLSDRERRVITGVAKRTQISRDANHAFDENLTVGDRLADRVATFGGSWTFITIFLGVLVAWTLFNSVVVAWFAVAFDPYPYIFLNLILSMLAAPQAPIIMMSQNRQAVRDRVAAGLDYEVNLKAELEIMALHEKLDQIRIEGCALRHGRRTCHPRPVLRDIAASPSTGSEPDRRTVGQVTGAAGRVRSFGRRQRLDRCQTLSERLA